MRVACALVSLRVGGDDADRRVLAGRAAAASVPPARRILRASASCAVGDSRTPATTVPGRRIDDVADGVDGDDGRDDEPVRQRDRRGADARLSSTCPAPPNLPTVAPAPAPTLPSCDRAAVAAPRPPCSRSRRSGGPSDCRRRRGRTGSPPGRSARAPARPASRCCAPRASVPCRSPRRGRTRCRPPARSALTLSTMFSGFSRSVSRVPGAPPRCDHAADGVAVDEDHRAAGRALGEREVADLDARRPRSAPELARDGELRRARADAGGGDARERKSACISWHYNTASWTGLWSIASPRKSIARRRNRAVHRRSGAHSDRQPAGR